MNRTGIQHASIAAEAVNGLNRRTLAALNRSDDSDLTRAKDAYEATTSLKLLAQRLTLASTQITKLVRGWHDEGHLRTAHAVDTHATVNEFSEAMARADRAALTLFVAYEDASNALARVGWQESAAPVAHP
jgi:hypothetical protein